jgi:hypothetical protein
LAPYSTEDCSAVLVFSKPGRLWQNQPVRYAPAAVESFFCVSRLAMAATPRVWADFAAAAVSASPAFSASPSIAASAET